MSDKLETLLAKKWETAYYDAIACGYSDETAEVHAKRLVQRTREAYLKRKKG